MPGVKHSLRDQMLTRGTRQTRALLALHRVQPVQRCLRFNSGFNRPPGAECPEPPQGNPVTEQLAASASFATHVLLRWLRYTVVGLVTLTVTSATAFEGVHQWVEKAELVPETDEEARKWQWDIEAERWSGGPSGGTDPGLGFVGRHAVRAAWIAQNWGIGSEQSVMNSNAFSARAGGSARAVNIVEARSEVAQAFLSVAVQHAQSRMSSGALRPQTITELLARHANIMERMGQRDALFEARSEYERVWAGLPGKGVDAARVALKLGDLNRRLGDMEDSLAWWSRAIQLTHNKTEPPPLPAIPQSLPSEPAAQRTFLSTLVSLSAFYATTGQLRQAQTVQDASLTLFSGVQQPESLQSASPAETLHALYTLHRLSLLSIHHAEVLYALRKKGESPLEWLTRAASSAERVALTLTSLPPIHPDAPQSQIPHPPSSDAPLTTSYTKIISLRKPATSLLRDARRTAAEAWNLAGVLLEQSEAPGSKERAVEYYERALGWAGIASDRTGGIGKAAESTLDSEWKVLWSNYVRARAAVKGQEADKK